MSFIDDNYDQFTDFQMDDAAFLGDEPMPTARSTTAVNLDTGPVRNHDLRPVAGTMDPRIGRTNDVVATSHRTATHGSAPPVHRRHSNLHDNAGGRAVQPSRTFTPPNGQPSALGVRSQHAPSQQQGAGLLQNTQVQRITSRFVEVQNRLQTAIDDLRKSVEDSIGHTNAQLDTFERDLQKLDAQVQSLNTWAEGIKAEIVTAEASIEQDLQAMGP